MVMPSPRAIAAAVLLASALAPASSGQPPPRRHALLIGINTHLALLPGVVPLAFAESAAHEIGTILETQGYVTTSLIGPQARREVILGELARLAQILRPEDELVVLFVGHVVRVKGGVRPHTY